LVPFHAIPYAAPVKGDVTDFHVIASYEIARLFVDDEPVATYSEPLYATDRPVTENNEVVARPVHVIPSGDVAIVLPEFTPPHATHSEPLQIMLCPAVTKTVVDTGDQVIPSVDVANLVVPCPTAMNFEPFHAMSYPVKENNEAVALPVQVTPFVDVAIVFPTPVAPPAATQSSKS
jgi:hypothetical protein